MPKLFDMADVQGHTVFCDDTRFEATGKLFHIGVYSSVMAIHVPFPFLLPTFSFAIYLAQRTQIYNPKIICRIFLPGDPDDASSDEASIVADLSEAQPGGSIRKADTHADAMGIPLEDRTYVQTFANLAFQRLEIKQPGTIKVRADIGDTRYRLGTLMVVAAPDLQPQS